MPRLKIIECFVLEKKSFKSFAIYGMAVILVIWSCDLYHLYKRVFPLTKEASHEASHGALIDQAVSAGMFEHCGRTMDEVRARAWVYFRYHTWY